jgi:hypothetical protein
MTALGSLLVVSHVAAQSFFGGGVVAYDPEITTVNSGAIHDAQVVVSHDRRYVTINAQGTESKLLALHDFQIAPPLVNGFVGGVTPNGASNGGGGFTATDDAQPAAKTSSRSKQKQADAAKSALRTSPLDIERRAIAARSILSQQGMFLLRAT